uniref:Uncharacterized protein n=1 Tax=Macaca nemestrina TaxID=9545 RepID=A0A2K6ANH1_MACNE
MPALEPAPPLLADLGPALEPKSRVALEAPGYLHSPPAPAPGEGSTPVTVLEPQSTRESPCPCPVNNQPTEELPDVTTFPPRLLAEQLTLMDALSQTSLSLRRGQYPGTNCSSTSYQPRDPDEGPHWKLSPMKLEFSGFSNKRDWMGTHKSLCLFTNLPFFLSSVHSKSTKYLKQLCKTDTAVKRDLLIKVQWNSGKPRHVNLRWHRRRPLPEWRKRRLDSAIPDDLDGNINKKRKEVRVLQEMQLLQVAAMNYRLRPLEKFVTYFKRLEQLSDKERLHCSVAISAHCNVCLIGSSPLIWYSMCRHHVLLFCCCCSATSFPASWSPNPSRPVTSCSGWDPTGMLARTPALHHPSPRP